MKKLALALFVLTITGVAFAAPKPQPKANKHPAFSQTFYGKVKVANKALANLVNLSCSVDPDMEKAAYLELRVDILDVLATTGNIPSTEPALDQVREIETTYGLVFITKNFVSDRNKKCNSDNDTTPFIIPHS